MEISSEQEHFKYIPFRCYFDDGYRQKLIKPVAEDGHRKTLADLQDEMFPGKTSNVAFYFCGLELLFLYLLVVYLFGGHDQDIIFF